jgi:hypothetical protein
MLVDLVGVILRPRGRNVILQYKYGSFKTLKNVIIVAKEVRNVHDFQCVIIYKKKFYLIMCLLFFSMVVVIIYTNGRCQYCTLSWKMQ